MQKLNRFYKDACLFDGFYDGQTVLFNKNRHRWNYFNFLILLLVFVMHLFVFITDNEILKNELVYFKFSDDSQSRYLVIIVFLSINYF